MVSAIEDSLTVRKTLVTDKGVDSSIIYKIHEFKLSDGKTYHQLEVILKESLTGVVFEMDEVEFYEGNIKVEKVNALYKTGNMVIPKELGKWNRHRFTGTGTIFTYLTLDTFLPQKITTNTSLIIENGVFACCEGSYKDVKMSFNLVTKLRYDDIFDMKKNIQTYIKGYGLLILRVPFKKTDIRQISLNSSRMDLDLRSVVMRTSAIKIVGVSEVITDNDYSGVKIEGTGVIMYCSLMGQYVKNSDIGNKRTQELFRPIKVEEYSEDNKDDKKINPLSALAIRPK